MGKTLVKETEYIIILKWYDYLIKNFTNKT